MNKYIFFAAWIAGQPFFANAMLMKHISRTPHKHSAISQIRKTSTTSPIVRYDVTMHERVVAGIAFQHMHKLMSGVTPKNRETLLQDEVIPTLKCEGVTTKVYVIDGEPAGFINYFTHQPWYACVVPTQFQDRIKLHATIQMLAVDDKYQGKRIGSTLIENALKDCTDQSVSKVTLGTTDPTLDEFYKRFGFIRTGGSTLCPSGPSQFTKWLSEQK